MAEEFEELAEIKILREYKRRHDMTQYELADVLGTPAINIHRWLSGKHKPSQAWRELIIQKLAK